MDTLKAVYEDLKERLKKEDVKYEHLLVEGALDNFDGLPIINSRVTEDNRFACVLFDKAGLGLDEIMQASDALKVFEVTFTCETWISNGMMSYKVNVYGLR